MPNDQQNLESLYESLLLEQPHMYYSLPDYEVEFDPHLEDTTFEGGVNRFKDILDGKLVQGKHGTTIQLPKDSRESFCKELVKDEFFLTYIKGWAAKRSITSGKTYTLDRFLRNTGISKFLQSSN